MSDGPVADASGSGSDAPVVRDDKGDIILTPDQIAAFFRDGYIAVRGVLTPAEVIEAQAVFDALMDGSIPVEGADRGEHTPGLFNVTAFTLTNPLERLGVFAEVDRRCAALVRQLYEGGAPMGRDYEQLLRKLPNRPTAQFPPHQVCVCVCVVLIGGRGGGAAPSVVRSLALTRVFPSSLSRDDGSHSTPGAARHDSCGCVAATTVCRTCTIGPRSPLGAAPHGTLAPPRAVWP
jgi:hypothetical protein